MAQGYHFSTGADAIRIRATYLENLTSSAKIIDPEDPKLGEAPNIEFVEFTEDGLVMELPKLVCNTGHQLMLKVETTGTKAPINFEATAKVVEAERSKAPEGGFSLTIKLVQYDIPSWNKLMTEVTGRQGEVATLFDAMKGYS